MDRRTALQSLIMVIAGAMDPEQKTTPTKPQTPSPAAPYGTFAFAVNAPKALSVYLQWTEVTVHRNGETVTIDQDALFKALKGEQE